MPARHRERHSIARRKAFTITLESCSCPPGIRDHDALETVNTMHRNMQYAHAASEFSAWCEQNGLRELREWRRLLNLQGVSLGVIVAPLADGFFAVF